LPAVEAEHGGFNEPETHVPLVVAGPGVSPGLIRAPVTTSQIAADHPPTAQHHSEKLQAVLLEGTKVLPGIKAPDGGDN